MLYKYRGTGNANKETSKIWKKIKYSNIQIEKGEQTPYITWELDFYYLLLTK